MEALLQVSFTLLIPAMLFTKVAATLAARPDPWVLATISAVTLLQVGAGALLAELVAPVVDRLLTLPQGPRPVVPATPGEAAGAGGLSETGGALRCTSCWAWHPGRRCPQLDCSARRRL